MAIETVEISTWDGVRLAGDLAIHPGAEVAVVLCHPHPRYGGDRQSPVVDAVFRALDDAHVMTVRFDFRGAGDSEGTHADGIDERLDVAAAIDLLGTCTDAPVWVVGYSFGAAVGLDVVHPHVCGWVAIAPPLTMMPGDRLAARDHRPKHLVLAGHDQFGDPESITAITDGWANTSTVLLDTADHFLAGHLAQVSAIVGAIVS